MLTYHFGVKTDPHGYGWITEVQPGREIAVEDGTEEIATMPLSIIKPASRTLGGMLPSKPKTRVVLMSMGEYLDDEDIAAIGRAFAQRRRVVLDNHAGGQQIF